MGDCVESLAEVKVDNIHCPPKSIVFGFGLYVAKAWTGGWKLMRWLSCVASCF